MILNLISWLNERDATPNDPLSGLSQREIDDMPAWHEQKNDLDC